MKGKLLAILLLIITVFSLQTPAAASTAENGPIENAFTDSAFLTEVYKLLGKTDGEHIYRSDVETIEKLKITSKDIVSFDGIEYFTSLKEFLCYANDIVTLDLSHNPNLEVLDCSYTYLTSLDVSRCPKLMQLDCNYTDLRSLDVRNNPNLTWLVAYGTYLEALDVSNNPLLEELDVWDCRLESLDVSNNPKLEYLDCSWNNMTSVEDIKGLSNCTLLNEDTFCFEPQNIWSDWVITTNPTLTETGEAERTCLNDNHHIKDTVTLPALTDTSVWTKGDNVAPTSEAEGYQVYNSVYGAVTLTLEKLPAPPVIGGIWGYIPLPPPESTSSDSSDNKNPFSDISENDWFFDSVTAAYKHGFMPEYSENKFSPYSIVTRGMFVYILYKLDGEPQTGLSHPFVDVPANEYFADAVAWANNNGIINGYSDTRYAPHEAITREQTAVIIYRYAEYMGLPLTASPDFAYADGADISAYAATAVSRITASRIMQGYENFTFHPLANTIRAEAAVVFERLYNLIDS